MANLNRGDQGLISHLRSRLTEVRAIMTSFTRSVQTPTGRLAISALAVAVVVFVAIGIAVELVFLPKASMSSTPSTATTSTTVYCAPPASCPTPSTTLKAAVNQWVADFNSRDVTALGNFYTQDASVAWTNCARSHRDLQRPRTTSGFFTALRSARPPP